MQTAPSIAKARLGVASAVLVGLSLVAAACGETGTAAGSIVGKTASSAEAKGSHTGNGADVCGLLSDDEISQLTAGAQFSHTGGSAVSQHTCIWGTDSGATIGVTTYIPDEHDLFGRTCSYGSNAVDHAVSISNLGDAACMNTADDSSEEVVVKYGRNTLDVTAHNVLEGNALDVARAIISRL